jgi:uncharacterized RDD family membrane protein YckC
MYVGWVFGRYGGLRVMADFGGPNFERRAFSDQLNIETPEQVGLQYSVAGIGSRFVAVLLDSLIIGAFYLVVILILVLVFAGAAATSSKASAALDNGEKWALAIIIFLNFLLLWGYFAISEGVWRGQTLGKRVMKLRVIKDSGRQITFFESLARNLLRFVDYMPGIYLVGVITMLCNKKNKRLGDFVAGTIVVHERAEEQPMLVQTNAFITVPKSVVTGQPWQQEAMAPWAQPIAAMFPADAVAKLGAQDLVVIEAFFARMLDLPMETRAALAYRIAGQMAAKMGVALPEGNPERVLEAIAFQMRSVGMRG